MTSEVREEPLRVLRSPQREELNEALRASPEEEGEVTAQEVERAMVLL